MLLRATRLLPLVLLTAMAPGFAQTHECREVMVKMRDGVELATDVYLPTAHGAGPFPVVLTRTPYGKGDCEDASAKYFAKHGYAAVSQDERGRHRSKGVYYWLRDNAWHERRDGYDTIEWAASRALVEWQGGNDGLVFHLREPASDGSHETAPSRGDVLRRVRLESLPGRVLRRRRAPHDHAHLAPHAGGNGEAASRERSGPGRISRERRVLERVVRKAPGSRR